MRSVNKTAKKTLDDLALAMGARHAAHVGEKGGTFMRVCLEWIAPDQLSVAHYYEQNGDLMADPEMLFFRGADGNWYPIYYKQDGLGIEQVSAERDGDGWRVAPRVQADHASFANQWMRNIRTQQGPRFINSDPGSLPGVANLSRPGAGQ
jgi:hypothetical protein